MRVKSIVKAIVLCAATLYVAHLFDTGSCTCGRLIPPVTAQEASRTADTIAATNASEPASLPLQTTGPRPKLVDLGAGKCKACKEMAPVLEKAKADYAGVADVEFIDVWENRDAGVQYGIRMIPTQIFYDAQGKEVMRHEGFLPREEIDRQFESLGVKLSVKAP